MRTSYLFMPANEWADTIKMLRTIAGGQYEGYGLECGEGTFCISATDGDRLIARTVPVGDSLADFSRWVTVKSVMRQLPRLEKLGDTLASLRIEKNVSFDIFGSPNDYMHELSGIQLSPHRLLATWGKTMPTIGISRREFKDALLAAKAQGDKTVFLIVEHGHLMINTKKLRATSSESPSWFARLQVRYLLDAVRKGDSTVRFSKRVHSPGSPLLISNGEYRHIIMPMLPLHLPPSN